jgi:hypothetical protein
VQYYVREAPHFFGMWRANMSNILLSWTYMKAIGRAALRTKSGFATHTAAEEEPEDAIMPNPPMPEKQEDSEWLLLLTSRLTTCLTSLTYQLLTSFGWNGRGDYVPLKDAQAGALGVTRQKT